MTDYALPKITGGRKTGSGRDRRLTVCKICRHSVMEGEPTTWLTKPMGMSHTTCADRVDR